MISVVMPVYNAASLLERAVATVVSQQVDYELLLVDDGSTDGSGSLCDALAAEHPAIRVVHKRNGGQASARNVGMAMARGEYVYFMDDDDELKPGALALLLRNMEASGADISAATYIVGGAPSQPPRNHNEGRLLGNGEAMEMMMRREIDIYLWTKLYRSAFIAAHKLAFDEGRSEEDIVFNLKAFAQAQSVYWEPEPIYVYYERATSTYRTFAPGNIEKHLSDIVYRTRLAEQMMGERYPSLMTIAVDQTLLYYFRALCIVAESGEAERFTTNADALAIWRYMKSHRLRLLTHGRRYGISTAGAIAIACLPMPAYLRLKGR